jgi:hypothetical protein
MRSFGASGGEVMRPFQGRDYVDVGFRGWRAKRALPPAIIFDTFGA